MSCGTESDVPAETDGLASKASLELPDEFVLCLSATFSHKNRPHALRVFEQLCEHHGFAGSLVIAGPEPFYGRSTEAERRLIDRMPASVRARIIRLGRIDERTKWCLLRSARLVLYPSVVEGFGLVPFEAAAVGTPSYGYSGSGLRELLDAAPCLISTWRVDEWAQAAHNAITDQQCASEIVAAINRAAQLHTWDRVATLTWDAIDATVASPHANARQEEGGWDSRIAPTDRTLGAGARTTHLAHRAIALVDRRLHGVAHGESKGEAEARDPIHLAPIQSQRIKRLLGQAPVDQTVRTIHELTDAALGRTQRGPTLTARVERRQVEAELGAVAQHAAVDKMPSPAGSLPALKRLVLRVGAFNWARQRAVNVSVGNAFALVLAELDELRAIVNQTRPPRGVGCCRAGKPPWTSFDDRSHRPCRLRICAASRHA